MKGAFSAYRFARPQADEIIVKVGGVNVKGRIRSLQQRCISVELLEPIRCEEAIEACLPSEPHDGMVPFLYSEIQPSGRQVLSPFGAASARELTEDLYLALVTACDLRRQMQEFYERAWKQAGVVIDSRAGQLPSAVEAEFTNLVHTIIPENVISAEPVVRCWMRYFRE